MNKISKSMLICLLASLMVGYQFTIQILPGLMIHNIIDHFQISLTDVGLLSSIMFYSYLIMQGPCGVLAQKIGPKYSLLCAASGLAFSCIILTYCNNYHIAILSRFMAGIFAAPCVISCFILCNILLPPKLFPFMCGVIEMMGMLGATVGTIAISNYTQKTNDWQSSTFWISIMGCLLFLLIIFIIKKDYSHPKKPPKSTKFNINSIFTIVYKNLKNVFAINGYLNFCMFGFFIFAILNSFGGLWLVPFVSKLYQSKSHIMDFLMTYHFAGATCGILGNSILVTYISPKKLMIGETAICTLTFALIIFIPVSFFFMKILAFILGLSSGIYVLTFGLIRKNTPPKLYGLSLGIANAIIISSSIVFQPLIGFLLNINKLNTIVTIHDYKIALLPMLIGLIIALYIAIKSFKTDLSEKFLITA